MSESDPKPSPPQRPERGPLGILAHFGWVPILCLSLWTGFRGLDFGVHWDEGYRIGVLEHMADAPGLLPDDYHYPTLVHWMGLAAALPELGAREAGAAPELNTRAFRLRWRGVFLVVSSLGALWLYLLVLRWRGSVPAACTAAALFAFSFEVAYHQRWIGPDAVLTQFAALALLGAVLAARERCLPWLVLGAVAAGLGTGTKYTGGLLVVPVLLAAFGFTERRWRALLIAVGCFALAFLITTPGALLELGAFRRDIAWQMEHYKTGHANYTIDAGWPHLVASVEYLGGALFSPWAGVAWALFLLVPLGAFALWREDRRIALVVLSFPVLHLAYMATQRVMMPRNLLQLAPGLAVLAALGVAWLFAAARNRGWRAFLVAATGWALAANVGWLVESARTIEARGLDARARRAGSARGLDAIRADLHAYLKRNPERRFHASPLVALELGVGDMPHVTTDASDTTWDADFALLFASEGMRWSEWPARDHRLTERWFGPREVNFDLYPSWQGDDRVLVLRMEKARDIGVRTVRPDLGTDPLALFQQALQLQRNNREHQAAIERYDRFLAANPEHAQATFNRAYAWMELGRFDDAIAGFERTLTLKPDYHEVHHHLATCLRGLGRDAEAEEHQRLYDASRG